MRSPKRSDAMRWIATFLLLASTTATAQDATAWVDCDSAAGQLVIEFRPGETGERYAGPAEHVVEFYDLLEVVDGKTIVATHEASIECRLGGDTLVVLLSPMISNVNLLGMCGAAISGRIDISRGDARVVDALPFEDERCMERGDDFVGRVTLRAGASEPEILRRHYDVNAAGEPQGDTTRQ